MSLFWGRDTEDDIDGIPDPHLDEQDEGILEVFARSEHDVLTNSEIADEVSIGKRQVRRRLDNLADRGLLGVRTPRNSTKIAWVATDVKEPITVKYPLLKYIIHRTSGIFFLIGLIIGIIAVQILLAAAIMIGYHVRIEEIPPDLVLFTGVIAAVFSALFFIVAGLNALIEWSFNQYGINLEESIRNWRRS